MIIDIHGYVVAPPKVYQQKASMLAEQGWGVSDLMPPREEIEAYARRTVAFLEEVGTDIQCIAPRPYHLLHGQAPARIVRRWISTYNDVIATQVRACPDRLRGIAGLPQIAGEGVETAFDEIDRCVGDLGFVGVLLNPDPGAGDGRTPGLGEPYWYPLYEKLVAHDIPAIVSSGPCASERENYNQHYLAEAAIAVLSILEHPRIFQDFPSLKLVIGNGGGSIPYQAGRWRARRRRQSGWEPFDTSLKRLWFDTVVHSPEALSLLFKVCGAERCLFGTQRPGHASAIDPETGRSFDDIKTDDRGPGRALQRGPSGHLRGVSSARLLAHLSFAADGIRNYRSGGRPPDAGRAGLPRNQRRYGEARRCCGQSWSVPCY